MAEQVRKNKQTSDRSEVTAEVTATTAAHSAQTKSDLDELLVDIDDVLESNAEDFVKSYVQKGGE